MLLRLICFTSMKLNSAIELNRGVPNKTSKRIFKNLIFQDLNGIIEWPRENQQLHNSMVSLLKDC